MKSLTTLFAVALAVLLVGASLWTLVLAPSGFSPGTVADPGFWMTIANRLTLLVGGFVLGRRAEMGEFRENDVLVSSGVCRARPAPERATGM
jgi:hypothetical protein